jgi:uncharacterized protein (DUF1330 family)
VQPGHTARKITRRMPARDAGAMMTEPASSPVFLLVIATVTDRPKVLAYARALADSGLYARHGGRYRFIGPAAAPLEDWQGQTIVCAEFPSRAAAEAFWHSAQYQQEIRPLREGAGEFHVALFDAAAFDRS